MRIALSLCALLLVSACAWTSDSVAVQRQSVPVVAVPGAAAVAVTVTAGDARQEREISHKKNGYGMRAADINAANDVITEVRSGVEEILLGQGFRPGSDATVRIEVSRFYNMFDMSFWSATANAQVTASLTVAMVDGRTTYARVYNGTNQMTGVQLMSGENAASSLRLALTALLRQIAEDPQLTQALLQARPTPAIPTAAAAGRGRTGA